jgi:hypothetical protein
MILYMRTALVLARLCCSKEVKRNAYTTLVRPSVEYASAVWDPYTRNQINQLEQVQRRAARLHEWMLRLRKLMVRFAFA